MTLIKTHDGQFGWINEGKNIKFWTNKENEAYAWGSSYFQFNNPADRQYFFEEFRYALQEMQAKNRTTAEFGIFGSFMFCPDEEAV
jgi:hypothetical protein